jgi:hypothetical protein
MTSGRWLPALIGMNPLQQQVVERGICFRCHSKTLAEKHESEDGALHFSQCTRCNHVFVTEAPFFLRSLGKPAAVGV